MGSTWQVGNDTYIAIWEDCWIPIPHRFQPLLPLRFPTSGRFVSQFNLGSREWDVDLLSNLFPDEDVYMILSIPLGHNDTRQSYMTL